MSATAWESVEKVLETFTPGEKLELIERVARSLRQAAPTPTPAQQQAALQQFLQKMAAMPLEGPDDGFSGRDHDRLLYGGPS